MMLAKVFRRIPVDCQGQERAVRACLLALIDRNRKLAWEVAINAILPGFPGDTTLRVQGETLADRRLPAFAYEQMFDEAGDVRNSSKYGRRAVTYVRKDDLWLVFKVKPELPGVEAAAGELSRAVFGSWMSPLTELMRWQDRFPVLVSGGVPGVPLQDALVDNPEGECPFSPPPLLPSPRVPARPGTSLPCPHAFTRLVDGVARFHPQPPPP